MAWASRRQPVNVSTPPSHVKSIAESNTLDRIVAGPDEVADISPAGQVGLGEEVVERQFEIGVDEVVAVAGNNW